MARSSSSSSSSSVSSREQRRRLRTNYRRRQQQHQGSWCDPPSPSVRRAVARNATRRSSYERGAEEPERNLFRSEVPAGPSHQPEDRGDSNQTGNHSPPHQSTSYNSREGNQEGPRRRSPLIDYEAEEDSSGDTIEEEGQEAPLSPEEYLNPEVVAGNDEPAPQAPSSGPRSLCCPHCRKTLNIFLAI